MGYAGQQHRFTLTLLQGGSDRFPRAATCFNDLKMYAYTSRDEMRERLVAAMNMSEGFDEAAAAGEND